MRVDQLAHEYQLELRSGVDLANQLELRSGVDLANREMEASRT